MALEMIVGRETMDQLQSQFPELLATAVCYELRLTCEERKGGGGGGVNKWPPLLELHTFPE